MADQQFLASFGVDIDESGMSRLQKIFRIHTHGSGRHRFAVKSP